MIKILLYKDRPDVYVGIAKICKDGNLEYHYIDRTDDIVSVISFDTLQTIYTEAVYHDDDVRDDVWHNMKNIIRAIEENDEETLTFYKLKNL